MTTPQLRVADLIVIAFAFLVMIAIGFVCARRSRSAEGYFLAGRSMPGWVVGFSMMATIVSSMTFLALPAFTYEKNWIHFPGNATFLLAMLVALVLFVPFYRKAGIRSAYEYLELRFGTWARLYAAFCGILFHIFRMGVILYIVALSVQTMVGRDLETILLVLGIIVTLYTITGGLQAVIWTDLIQGVTLIGGGLICMPIILNQLPGGFSDILTIAADGDKFSFGNTSFNFSEQTMWSLIFTKLFIFLQVLGADQTSIQRYCAARSDKDARTAVLLGCVLTVPVWTYFFFVGTAMYVFYQAVPGTDVSHLKPDQILPHFILTQIPAGLAGFVITGLLAAAMSTLDSSINAAAATLTTDFYQRLVARDRSPQHYAYVGRLLSLAFGVIMIGTALVIHQYRAQEAMEDIQTLILSILGGGLLSLFLIGFLTVRVDSRAALIATLTTVTCVVCWLILDSFFSDSIFWLPSKMWMGVFSNLLLFTVGYAASFLGNRQSGPSLEGLTIWTTASKSTA